jgi:hypothetical protein
MAAYMTNQSNFATAHLANGGSGEVIYLRGNGGPFIRAVNYDEDDTKFQVDFHGNVRADGAFISPAADFAEMLPANDGLEAGDVLIVGADNKLARSTQARQANVLGVYSSRPAFIGGKREGEAESEKIPSAVVGIVPVKVTAEGGATRPGDLLTTSSTPGRAMKAWASRAWGWSLVRL